MSLQEEEARLQTVTYVSGVDSGISNGPLENASSFRLLFTLAGNSHYPNPGYGVFDHASHVRTPNMQQATSKTALAQAGEQSRKDACHDHTKKSESLVHEY